MSYRFNIKDGKSVGDNWRWCTYSDENGAFKMELYTPTSAEWNKFVERFRIGQRRSDYEGAIRHIAMKWFRDFEGAKDPEGESLPNDLPNRSGILMKYNLIHDYVYEQLKIGAGVEEAEGNGSSGTG